MIGQGGNIYSEVFNSILYIVKLTTSTKLVLNKNYDNINDP